MPNDPTTRVSCCWYWFYNVENLFDTIDNPTTYDEDYTPSGKLRWTPEKFHQKIKHIGHVIARIGNENHVHGPVCWDYVK